MNTNNQTCKIEIKEKAICFECSTVTDDLYYYAPEGRRMKSPRCGACNDDAELRSLRDGCDNDKWNRPMEYEN